MEIKVRVLNSKIDNLTLKQTDSSFKVLTPQYVRELRRGIDTRIDQRRNENTLAQGKILMK